jgi:alanyl-tRNA synthetase
MVVCFNSGDFATGAASVLKNDARRGKSYTRLPAAALLFSILVFRMMTSTQIRQSFLDFFKSKQHTIVPSSSLMPDSPNLLFTNAGMNQFVPIFLGQTQCPYTPGRAADTQKCIRAGGKHNDLDDVGLDTYHHTFFEMLGNWSFGDYFKKEAIEWAWELVVGIWQFPPQRLYATVYSPDKSKNDPSEFDQEAWNFWAEKFRSVGLDPAVHIVNGNKKDNFWMMGETGPCGPCSELHVDLTPAGDTQGSLVNKGDARCIEIWNLVFMQFNANPDGTFSPLPAVAVDTGMGFERVTSIIQGTKNLTDFAHAKISNYETDIFRPIFDKLEEMSGKTYKSTLPGGQIGTFPPAGDAAEGQSSNAEGHSGNAKGYCDNTKSQSSNAKGYCVNAKGQSVNATEQSFAATEHCVDAKGQRVDAMEQKIDAKGQRVAASEHGAAEKSAGDAAQIAVDIAFRVIADHIRTLSFAIADGIQPGNNDRNYVLRRILRRAVRYGRTLGFKEPFFYKLVDVLADTMGDVFPEIRARKKQVQQTIRTEEEAFNKTLDNGIRLFADYATIEEQLPIISAGVKGRIANIRGLLQAGGTLITPTSAYLDPLWEDATAIEYDFLHLSPSVDLELLEDAMNKDGLDTQFIKRGREIERIIWSFREAFPTSDELPAKLQEIESALQFVESRVNPIAARKCILRGEFAFRLYDTYGFPLDLTELMARERGLTVDKDGFERLMEEQRARARAAQKKEVISLSQIETTTPTKFVGYEDLAVQAKVLEVVSLKDKTAVILDTSACYGEMGGQVGDTGEISGGGNLWRIANTQKSGNTWLHFINDLGTAEEIVNRKSQIVNSSDLPAVDSQVTLTVDKNRRSAIQRHHTVTHLLHWALHEVASREASQKGSFVGPDKLTFDFNSAPLTPAQVADIEKLVNERILENAGVSWTEVPHADVKHRKDVMQFFGDKYGDTVRVVQIGGAAGKLDGYSMELCGGTHTRATGEIGLFRIVGESAIAAGVRRIEAVAGLTAYGLANEQLQLIKTIAGKINSPVGELEKKVESLLAHQKELEKQLKAAHQKEAANAAGALIALSQVINGTPAIINNLGHVDGEALQHIVDALKSQFKGVVVLGGAANGAVTLIASVSADFTAKIQAGKIIQAIAPIVGGKGGGKPDNARGGGKDAAKLDEALAKARSLL